MPKFYGLDFSDWGKSEDGGVNPVLISGNGSGVYTFWNDLISEYSSYSSSEQIVVSTMFGDDQQYRFDLDELVELNPDVLFLDVANLANDLWITRLLRNSITQLLKRVTCMLLVPGDDEGEALEFLGLRVSDRAVLEDALVYRVNDA